MKSLEERVLVLEKFAEQLKELAATPTPSPTPSPNPPKTKDAKDSKDNKDSPDQAKDAKDTKDLSDKSVQDRPRFFGGSPQEGYIAGLHDMIARLQTQNSALAAALQGERSRHFISAEARPEMSIATVQQEPDLGATEIAALRHELREFTEVLQRTVALLAEKE